MHDSIPSKLPAGVAEHLGYYVYLYSDPRSGEPFYVGKGRGNRILAHFGDEGNSPKTSIIRELRDQGLTPRLEILAHGLKDEETAFRVEAAVIDALGLPKLTNRVRGWKSLQVGRMSLDDLAAFYAAEPTGIQHPCLVIRVNKMFRKDMSATELYEATRGIWKLGPRRENARFALACFEGLVREVYEIRSWHPAGTLSYETRTFEGRSLRQRWEFQGELAPPEIRDWYLNKTVKHYFKRGNQSPVLYVNVPARS